MKDPKECANCRLCITTDMQTALSKGIHSNRNLKNTWPVEFYCKKKFIPVYSNMAMECRYFEEKPVSKQVNVYPYQYADQSGLSPA